MLKELRQLWDNLPFKTEFALLLTAWIALFHLLGNSVLGYVDTRSLFVWLNTLHTNAERTDSDDAFGRYVPLLVLLLMVVRRRELTAAVKRVWTPGLWLLAAAILLHAMGFLVQQTRLSIVAFLLGGYGLMGLLWGPAWLRAIFFPYFLLIFAIPVVAYLDGPTFRLRLFSTASSTWICTHLLGINLLREGTLVFFPGLAGRVPFQFDVAPACSGIRSATIVLLLTVAYGWLTFTSWWRRLAVIAASVPLAILGNIVRLVVTFGISGRISQKAGSYVETKAGMITFLVALVGVFAFGRLLRERNASPPSDPAPTPPIPAPAAAI